MLKRKYNSKTVKKLFGMFKDILGKKPENLRKDMLDTDYDLLTKVWDFKDGDEIDDDLKITEVYTVEDLFLEYDKHVPLQRRLFWLEYDAHIFQGIYTIDELIVKLEKDGYFKEEFWSRHSSKKEARKDFEDYKINDSSNIAYEMLWGVTRIV